MIAASLKTAQAKKLLVESETLSAVKRKLADASTESPHYWETVGVAVTYESVLRDPRFDVARVASMATCFDSPVGIILARSTASNCVVELDGMALLDVEISDGVVIYRGGSLYLKNVTFKNCYFILNLPSFPAAPGRRVGKDLLAQDRDSVTLNVGS